MAASTTDKMIKTGASTVTTLSAPGKALAATSLTVGSTTNYPTDTGIVIAIRVVDSAGELVAGTYTEWLATVTSGTTLAIDASPVYGTDQVYAAGSTTQVFIPLSSYAHNRLIDGVLVEHTQAGVHTLSSNSTITSSKVITGLNDTNGNELIKVTPTASAVNEITVTNAAAGSDPSISATGADTNIDLNLIPKGTGHTQQNGRNIDWWEELGRTTLTSVGSTITITGIPARKYLKIIGNLVDNGSAITGTMTFNNDSAANYAQTNSTAGAADGSLASQNSLVVAVDSAATPRIFEMEVVNNTAKEKLFQGHAMSQGAAGAATVPIRREINGKWANTSTQITRLDVQTSTANNFAVGSEVIVLGHD